MVISIFYGSINDISVIETCNLSFYFLPLLQKVTKRSRQTQSASVFAGLEVNAVFPAVLQYAGIAIQSLLYYVYFTCKNNDNVYDYATCVDTIWRS